MLARLLSEEPMSATGERVRVALEEFGEESGLFREVEVKKLGKGSEEPFQVQVSVGGPKVNLIDVGYGVSQSLPLIVQSMTRGANNSNLLLIQQPEVHLHPRAQAALGTFFARLVSGSRDTILIETHSDFLVDRVRQEVARGTLKPEQVQLLFFDKPKVETTIYPIQLDAQGNVEGAPESYRTFFLEEELRLLS
jgi:predicted ATPase